MQTKRFFDDHALRWTFCNRLPNADVLYFLRFDMFKRKQLLLMSIAIKHQNKFFFISFTYLFVSILNLICVETFQEDQPVMEFKFRISQPVYTFIMHSNMNLYEIDFKKMEQLNVISGKTRAIRRRPLYVSLEDSCSKRRYFDFCTDTVFIPTPNQESFGYTVGPRLIGCLLRSSWISAMSVTKRCIPVLASKRAR